MSSLSHLPADHIITLAAMLGCSFGIGVWAIGHVLLGMEAR